jgi:hypothetical protein
MSRKLRLPFKQSPPKSYAGFGWSPTFGAPAGEACGRDTASDMSNSFNETDCK